MTFQLSPMLAVVFMVVGICGIAACIVVSMRSAKECEDDIANNMHKEVYHGE